MVLITLTQSVYPYVTYRAVRSKTKINLFLQIQLKSPFYHNKVTHKMK